MLQMKIGAHLQKILDKKYAPGAVISRKLGTKNATFKTDGEGNPISLFVGTPDVNGRIKGDRFVRTLIKDQSGNVIKDHWDRKGKA
jgi:hypothetical protein